MLDQEKCAFIRWIEKIEFKLEVQDAMMNEGGWEAVCLHPPTLPEQHLPATRSSKVQQQRITDTPDVSQ